MPTSPNVQNYHIGKGIVSFKEAGASDFVDLGNAPSFVYTPTIEKLEHFSSREGVKTKDFTAITQTGATITFTLDEITGLNLAFFALAEQGTDTDGNITVSGLSEDRVRRRDQGRRHQRHRPAGRLPSPPSRSSRPVISVSSPPRMSSRCSRSRPRCRRMPTATSASGPSATKPQQHEVKHGRPSGHCAIDGGRGRQDRRHSGSSCAACMAMPSHPLSRAFPRLGSLLSGDVGGDIGSRLIARFGAAVGPIIAAGCGHLGDEKYEQHAGTLLLEHQLKLVTGNHRADIPKRVQPLRRGTDEPDRRGKRRSKDPSKCA